MSDLNDLINGNNADKGVQLEIEHPLTGEVMKDEKGKPFTITLLGTDSKVYRNMQRDLQNSNLQKRMKGKSVELIPTDDAACEALASLVVGWYIVKGGKPLDMTFDNAVELFMTVPSIRDAVDVFIANRSNFFTVA